MTCDWSDGIIPYIERVMIMKEDIKSRELTDFELKKATGGNEEETYTNGTNNQYCKHCGYHTPHHSDQQGRYRCDRCGN